MPDRVPVLATDGGRDRGLFAKAFQHAEERSHAAATLVISSVHELHTQAASFGNGIGPFEGELRSFAARAQATDRRIREADVEINGSLRDLYRLASQDLANAPDMVRVALLHWTVALRRQSMEGYHTAVPGLVDDPDCAGDVISDAMFTRYFDAVMAGDQQKAVAALIDLARQSACLGTSQSAHLAADMYSAYLDLASFLRAQGREDVLADVVQALVAPILLFYDVEKYRGGDAPLSRWIAENRDLLIQGLRASRNPLLWHGVWLYDRRAGRLVGYRPTQRPRDENDIDLERFLWSLSNPANLGNGSCSLMEMVSRGSSPLGYVCAGHSCEESRGLPGAGGANRAALTQESLRPAWLGQVEDLQASSACKETGAGDPGANGSCTGGLSISNGSEQASMIRCLSRQVARPGTEAMSCFAEATGFCSSPANLLAKAITETEYAGVKLGNGCQVSAGMGEVHLAEEAARLRAELARARAEEQKWAAEERSLHGVIEGSLKYSKAEKVNEAEAVLVVIARAVAEANRAIAAAKVKELEEEQRKSQPSPQPSAAPSAAPSPQPAPSPAPSAPAPQPSASPTGPKTGCRPDLPGCEDNACSAMSESMQRTMACFKRLTSQDGRDPYASKTGGCNPTVCDPIDSPQKVGERACLGNLDADPSATTAKNCWAYRCASGLVVTAGANGACVCQPEGGLGRDMGRVHNPCETAYCSPDAAAGARTATFQNGSCSCNQPGTAGSPPPSNPRGFELPAPASFLHVNPTVGVGARSDYRWP